MKYPLRDYFSRTGKRDGFLPTEVERPRGREHAHRALYEAAPDRRRHGTGGPGSRAICLASTAFEEADVDGMFVRWADKRDVRAVRKMRMPFDFGAHRPPVELEVVTNDGALGISDIHQSDVSRARSERQFEALGFEHR